MTFKVIKNDAGSITLVLVEDDKILTAQITLFTTDPDVINKFKLGSKHSISGLK